MKHDIHLREYLVGKFQKHRHIKVDYTKLIKNKLNISNEK